MFRHAGLEVAVSFRSSSLCLLISTIDHGCFVPLQSLFKAYAFGAALTFSLLTIAAEAQVAKPQVMFSGFATLAAGKIIGGSHDELVDLDYQCPCFISDYAQNGVCEQKRLRLGPDSKLGVQGQVSSANGQYSLTGQLVSRGAAGGILARA